MRNTSRRSPELLRNHVSVSRVQKTTALLKYAKIRRTVNRAKKTIGFDGVNILYI